MQMAGRATWAGMPFPCKWMKRGWQLPIRVDRNTVSCRVQEGNLRGEDFTERRLGKRTNTKKGAPGTLYPRDSGWKEAATYSPALHCSTIGASGLNFSVRNGKRWDPTAITTWCIFFSWQLLSWRVDKLFVLFCWWVWSWQVDKLFIFLSIFLFALLSLLIYQATCLLVNY